jgi:hypothetical protein
VPQRLKNLGKNAIPLLRQIKAAKQDNTAHAEGGVGVVGRAHGGGGGGGGKRRCNSTGGMCVFERWGLGGLHSRTEPITSS